MNRQNCRICKCWKLLCYYHPYYSSKHKKEYLRKTCESCCRKKDKIKRIKNRKFIWYGESVDPKPLLTQAKLLELNKKEIACAAKVDPRRVYDWIRGKRKISVYAADNLCIALGIHLNLAYPYDINY